MKELGFLFNPFDKNSHKVLQSENSGIMLQKIANSDLILRIIFLRTQILKNAFSADLGSLSRTSRASQLQDLYIVEYLMFAKEVKRRNLN